MRLTKPSRGSSLLDWATEAWEAIRRQRVIAGPGIHLSESPSGTVISAKPAASPSVPREICPFGEIITVPAVGETPASKAIRGGLIQIGTENWNMDAEPIDLTTAGVWLVSIPVDCIVIRDDDEEVLLPGIESATRPTEAWTLTAWAPGTDYPSSSPPSVPDGAGTVVLPIGKLTVTVPDGAASGTASLEPTGCGGFHVSHCSGNFEHSRGAAAAFDPY